jgi:hypothetical protein
METATVEGIAEEATRRGQIIGVRLAETGDDGETAPWAALPLSKALAACPWWGRSREVGAILAQRLFLEKTGLPSVLLNQIKRLAAFQNRSSTRGRRCDSRRQSLRA